MVTAMVAGSPKRDENQFSPTCSQETASGGPMGLPLPYPDALSENGMYNDDTQSVAVLSARSAPVNYHCEEGNSPLEQSEYFGDDANIMSPCSVMRSMEGEDGAPGFRTAERSAERSSLTSECFGREETAVEEDRRVAPIEHHQSPVKRDTLGSLSAPNLAVHFWEEEHKPEGYTVDMTVVPSRLTSDVLQKFKALTISTSSHGHRGLARVQAWVDVLDLSQQNVLQGPERLEAVEEPKSPVAAMNSSLRPVTKPHKSPLMDASEEGQSHAAFPLDVEVEYANRSVNAMDKHSVTANLSAMALKHVPSFASFSCLKSLLLANNLITRVGLRVLPRTLHVLDLSHNRLTEIEGLRELSRLRFLNLSHNRISRIGHGLASCASLKELYLADNKISEVEGLHRLHKLTVVDLADNKISSTKSLGQIASNYGSLLAINLIGNPVHTNLGDDALRKHITGILPHLVYFNKQRTKAVHTRDIATGVVARAAMSTQAHISRSTKTTTTSSRSTVAGKKVSSSTVHTRRSGVKATDKVDRHHRKSTTSRDVTLRQVK